jgi:hypothetical protein
MPEVLARHHTQCLHEHADDHTTHAHTASAVGDVQMVKMGVQYSLWGGSVVNLGTERHREKYFDDIDSFRLPGFVDAVELEEIITLLACPNMHSGPLVLPHSTLRGLTPAGALR